MTYTVDTPIVGKGVTNGAIIVRSDAKRKPEIHAYRKEVTRLCRLIGFNEDLLIAQADVETDSFRSRWWEAELNPAGIGIFDDGSTQRIAYANGTDAARAQIVHMAVYVGHDLVADGLGGFVRLDPRHQAVIDAGFAGTVRVLGDLGGGRWATDPNYATTIAERANRMISSQEVPTPVSTELRIILNPGHRNTTGGNDEERDMTPALAQSYFDAFSAAGYETVNLGDTSGGLDETCRRMAAMIASAPGPCVLLDLHYEGSPAPGVFCIVPDVTGLTTGAPVAQDPTDTWNINLKDRTLAGEISERISTATGLQLRTGIREPGIMDESETGVGGDGFRLATFAYTSPYRNKAVRLVVEHGNHTIQPDRAIIMQPDFTDKCAAAAVAAVKAVYGGTTVPDKPKYTQPLPVPFEEGDYGWHKLNDIPFFCLEAEVEIVRNTRPKAWADGDAPDAGPMQKKGEKVKIKASGANRNKKGQLTRWNIRASDGARISGSACSPALPYKP